MRLLNRTSSAFLLEGQANLRLLFNATHCGRVAPKTARVIRNRDCPASTRSRWWRLDGD
jgi:hypothetical protein